MGTGRRIAWIVLCVAGGVVAARVLAARSTEAASPEPAPPPAVPPPVPPAAGRATPDRRLLRMAVAAASIVVLAIAVVVVTRPPAGGGLATPPMVTTRSPGPHGMYIEVTAPGPVGRDERVALTGDPGVRVEVGTRLHLEQPSLDDPGRRLVFFTVHVRNTGTVPVLARLAPDAWVLDKAGRSHPGDPMRSDMVDMVADPPQLAPGWEADLTAGFPVPKDARLTRLHIALPLGGRAPGAEWHLR